MTDAILSAPFDGWLAPLGEVPDEAFATELLGGGVALDPLEGTVRAPCNGVIAVVAATGHSVTLRHQNGADILIHIGIDTVVLRGSGFERVVAVGDRVASGDVLLRFDLDQVGRNARSLLTPLVVLGEDFEVEAFAVDRRVSAGEPIGVFRPRGDRSDRPAGPVVPDHLCRLRIPLLHGIHARPAARIAATLKPFEAQVTIQGNGGEANARSVTALLKLDLRHGTEIAIAGSGSDAVLAVEALAASIASGLADEAAARGDGFESSDVVSDRELRTHPDAGAVTADRHRIAGIRAAPGGAEGVAFRLRSEDRLVPELGHGVDAEHLVLETAIEALRQRLAKQPGNEIAEAHLAICEDPELRKAMDDQLASGLSAAAAARAALRAEAAALRSSGNAILAERAADLLDVERQLIGLILGEVASTVEQPDGAIVIAEDVLPSQFVSLDPARLAAIVTAGGGATSHVAILAASRGVPMIVACGDAILDVADGTVVVVAPVRAEVLVDPQPAALAAFRADMSAADQRARAEAASAQEDCITRDGRRIGVFANCGSVDDARRAAINGAEGCGLLRTEFLFLGRTTPPTREEQAATYAAVGAALAGRPIIVRTLDAGSDKPLAYLPTPVEENPALGARGIRLSLSRPEVLAEQFEAIITGLAADQRRIMLPMVTDLAELRAAKAILRDVEARVGAENPTELGIMIETPSAALLAEKMAEEADFLSIGSNDLTQYVLAADRQNPLLTAMADPLHPAVLRLFAQAAKGARAHGRWIGVCGGVASDPAATAILVGLGIDELSVSPPAVPAVKSAVRRLVAAGCEPLAAAALDATSASEVRNLVEEHFHAFAL
ncbi:phosphoenolpyruvate--protein phosphotransferase [Novosphingobium sp. PS1R-30]|uniref:phosphoenolpyruvate--protein phosphotransferase n=1 Tax=Novosphingobium anseongense TaxID=3133436 RepID=A0ABU8S0V5_9SPHN